jgi:hypothetical protein
MVRIDTPYRIALSHRNGHGPLRDFNCNRTSKSAKITAHVHSEPGRPGRRKGRYPEPCRRAAVFHICESEMGLLQESAHQRTDCLGPALQSDTDENNAILPVN